MRKKSKEKWDLIKPYYGAQIRVKKPHYYHHGIYATNDCVIHFGTGDQDLKNAKENIVHTTSLQEFLGLDYLEVRVYNRSERKKLKSTEEIVKMALSRVNEMNYDFLHNNCEHFSNECAFGIKYSLQAEQFREVILKQIKK